MGHRLGVSYCVNSRDWCGLELTYDSSTVKWLTECAPCRGNSIRVKAWAQTPAQGWGSRRGLEER